MTRRNVIDDIDYTDIGCFVIAAAFVIGGVMGTGFLPPTLRSQLVAGGLIVVGFALVFVCFR